MAIDKVPPPILSQINYLLSHSPLSALPIKVEQMWSGSKNLGLIDRFTLVIPFCLDFIKWDIIYNAVNPSGAPDFVFGPEDESFRPYDMSGKTGDSKISRNCLSDWNYKDQTRLLSLILELRELYNGFQKKQVGEVDDERVKFELSTMLSREGIEMSMSSGIIDKPEEVKFAVPLLDMDINKMILGCPWRGQQKIYLQVIYPVGRKYMSASSAPRLKLVSSPELKSLFPIEDVSLPGWMNGMCMAEYLPNLETMLQSQIADAVLSIEVRRKFLVALATLFGRPLEADPIFCRNASFLASSGVFSFLVHFTLPPQFPKHQPGLVLQSSQHFNSAGTPIKSALITKFPWSPRWDSSEMAERIFDFLVDECLDFKKYCNESQPQQR